MSQIQGITNIVNSSWMLKRTEECKSGEAGFLISAAKKLRPQRPLQRSKPVNHTVSYR